MRLKSYAKSDVGCVREANEDMILVDMRLVRDEEHSQSLDTSEQPRLCLLVSDGMGGHEKGEEASEFCLSRIRAAVLNPCRNWENAEQQLCEEIEAISRELNETSVREGQQKAMGCTLTGFVFIDDKILSINVGDSRTYRLRDGILRQLSSDQTLAERDQTPLPQGKALYSCIGGGCIPEVCTQRREGSLLEGDRYLLCSDGLCDMIDEMQISAILGTGSVESAGYALVEAAKAAGGRDNVSVLLFDIIEECNIVEQIECGSEETQENSTTITLDNEDNKDKY